ncbi:MAG: type II toxin-antitoxin system YafQ family toxin, partial [Treponemataceae bacterium]|nr:type II toxin-antitoxin system YafQ family toxin [Treponemataceae bacterium]
MECILRRTSQFKSSFKRAKKRGLNIALLEEVVGKLMQNKPLEEKHHNHELVGNMRGIWASQIPVSYTKLPAHETIKKRVWEC